MTFNDELVTAEIGQVGTQFDGLGHPMIRITGVKGVPDDNYLYNGVRLSEVLSPRGLKKNGTHNVGSFFTRGILIDVTALKGVDQLEIGYVITLDDYKKALQAQGIGDAEQGDVVLFRTGWNQWWKDNHTGNKTPDQIAADNKAYGAGEPGVAPEVCDYLAERKISMIGSDTWGLEPYNFPKDGPPEVLRLLPHEPGPAARHLQLREPRSRRPVAGEGLRVPVLVGPDQAGRRYRRPRQSDRGVLTRPSIGSGAGPRAGSFIHDVPGGAERGVAPSGVCRHTGGSGGPTSGP